MDTLTKMFGPPHAGSAAATVERRFKRFGDEVAALETRSNALTAEYAAKKRTYDEACREWPAYKAALDAEAQRLEAKRRAEALCFGIAANLKQERRQQLRAVAAAMRSKADAHARDFAQSTDTEPITKWFAQYKSQFEVESFPDENYVIAKLLHADGSVSWFRSERLCYYFEYFKEPCDEPSKKLQDVMYECGYGLHLAWICNGSVCDERYFGLHARLGCNVRTDDIDMRDVCARCGHSTNDDDDDDQ